jgi:adenylate kinase
MDLGQLVADDIVLGLVRERLAQPDARKGFILDGFPRNLAQAEAVDGLLKEIGPPLDAVVQLEVDNQELIRRIAGRRTCAGCGRVFNVFSSPPAKGELCPKTHRAHELTQRPDDNEATVTKRLGVYDKDTRPLADFYRKRGLLRVINAEGDLDEVTRRLEGALADVGPASSREPQVRHRTAPAAVSVRETVGRKAKPAIRPVRAVRLAGTAALRGTRTAKGPVEKAPRGRKPLNAKRVAAAPSGSVRTGKAAVKSASVKATPPKRGSTQRAAARRMSRPQRARG